LSGFKLQNIVYPVYFTVYQGCSYIIMNQLLALGDHDVCVFQL